jgi:hypothetical protein
MPQPAKVEYLSQTLNSYEKARNDKHSSLFCLDVSGEEKKLCNIVRPVVNVLQLFTVVSYDFS